MIREDMYECIVIGSTGKDIIHVSAAGDDITAEFNW